MIGLRKVVRLRIFDLPECNSELNKDNNAYNYSWKNKYYIGNTEIHKSKRYDNIVKKPLLCNNCDDNYLDKMIDYISSDDENVDSNIVFDDDYLFYDGGESSIYYCGNNVDKIKKKIYKK